LASTTMRLTRAARRSSLARPRARFDARGHTLPSAPREQRAQHARDEWRQMFPLATFDEGGSLCGPPIAQRPRAPEQRTEQGQ
jgi:hypothetical protein